MLRNDADASVPSEIVAPADHDRSSRAAALSFTREKDTLTAGVLYETSEPSLLDRVAEVRRRALEQGPIASTRELLESFVPRFRGAKGVRAVGAGQA